MGSSRDMACMEFFQLLYISAWHSLHSWLLVMDGVSISKALKSMREAKGNAISAVIERKSNTDFLAIFPPLLFPHWAFRVHRIRNTAFLRADRSAPSAQGSRSFF